MSSQTQNNPVFVDNAGALAQNLECVQCSYNLRGLSVEANCPECGAGISESIPGEGFLRAAPSWLERLCTGLSVIYASLILSIFIFVFTWPVVIIGCVQFTAPMPGDVVHEACESKRILARWVLLISTIVLLVAGASFVGLFFYDLGGMHGGWIFLGVWETTLLGIYATWIAMYGYAAEIARRFAEPALLKSSRRMVKWSAIVLGSAPVISLGIGMAAALEPIVPTSILPLLFLALVGNGFGALMVLIFTLGLVERFGRQMRHAIRELRYGP